MKKKEINAKPVLTGTALLKVKCIHHSMNPESIPFEDYITSSNTSIKIDFPNGRSLMEKGFKSHTVLMDKFYIEFFDEFNPEDMMDYLVNEQSNFRVTSLEGSVIRLSHEDYKSIPKELEEVPCKKPLKEFEFAEEKVGIFQKIKKAVQKKDN